MPLHILMSPLGCGVSLALMIGIIGRRFGFAVFWLLLTLEMGCVLLTMPIGANLLVWMIESEIKSPETCALPLPTTIVILAGGTDYPPADASDFAALQASSTRRLLAGVALWHRSANATLALAGGGSFLVKESALLENFAERLGVPAAAIRREARSNTTWGNATQLRALEPPLDRRIWLVSSAVHLPRAMVAFEAAGFDVCPYASDRLYLAPRGIGYFLPQSSALLKSEAAIHELAGNLVYRWRASRLASSGD